MSTIGIREFDAAQALLDLQDSGREGNQNGGPHSKEAVDTAQLLLSCLVASNVQTPPNKCVPISRVGTVNPTYAVPKTNVIKPSDEPSTSTHTPKRKSPDQELPRDPHFTSYHEEYTNRRSKIFKKKPIKYVTITSGPSADKVRVSNEANEVTKADLPNQVNMNSLVKDTVKTRDVGTQTENLYELSVIETMDFKISKLCDKMKTLEAQIQSHSQEVQTFNQNISDNDDDDETYKPSSNDATVDKSIMYETCSDSVKESRVKNKCGSNRSQVKTTKVLSNRNINNDGDDMVPIGYGNAMIPARIFRHINWNSYTSATRKLLTAVFSRRVLATHSLTGKPSPAFPLKPAKKRLDSAIVNDIVQTVVERCRVPENVVRTTITTKCADESKMFRTCQQNKKKRKHKVNRANILPDSESD